MSTLRLYNTLARTVEPFTPIDATAKKVTFYSCGPTVYDYAHIGNFRSFLNADLLRRTLELLGYSVRHVMNITDVGHMTDDAAADGGGEDKMQVASRRLAEAKKSGRLPEGVELDPGDPCAIANFYADAFVEDALRLGMRVVEEAKHDPSLMPRPTAYVREMIALVEKLIAGDHAYVADDGVVYFDVRSFPEYGRLSGNTLDSLREGEGGRISEANQAMKRHPADFMLWKPDVHHLMRWPSPWGEGYPGWHLECSVMAQALLAPQLSQRIDGATESDRSDATGAMIDLHSGGEDNIFPHHECEIAQSCASTGCSSFARYWFHTRHLIVEGEKMSKSKGNFFTVRDLLSRGATPAAIRLELIRTHYRINANFTLQGLKDCQRQIDRWARAAEWLARHAAVATDGPGPLRRALPAFTDALCDDLNVAKAIGALNEAINEMGGATNDRTPTPGSGPTTLGDELDALRSMDSVLAVLDRNAQVEGDGQDDESTRIEALIAERTAARAAKDFAASDRIRDELLAMGIAIKDGAGGTTWSRAVK